MGNLHKVKRWKYGLVIGVLVAVTAVAVSQTDVRVKGITGIVSISIKSAQAVMPGDSELVNGLWYSDIDNPIIINGLEVSFMKIYSLGATRRVMELSTYPRAYKDTSPHVYTVDTPFTVTEGDLNNFYFLAIAEEGQYEIRPSVEDGTRACINFEHGKVWLLGETGIHYAGDPLPGVFPLWLESETLPTPSWVDNKQSIFPMVIAAVKGELVQTTLYEGVYKQNGDTSWTPIPTTLFNQLKAAFEGSTDSTIKVNKITRNKDRTIIRILYDKAHIP